MLAGLAVPDEVASDPRVKDDEGVDGSEERWDESSSAKFSRVFLSVGGVALRLGLSCTIEMRVLLF